MRVSLFAGARRPAMVLGTLWVIGIVAYAVADAPPVPVVYYTLDGPNAAPVRANDCDANDVAQSIAYQRQLGR